MSDVLLRKHGAISDLSVEPPLLAGLLKRLEMLGGQCSRIEAGLNRLGCDMNPPGEKAVSARPIATSAVETLANLLSDAEDIADVLTLQADRLDRTI